MITSTHNSKIHFIRSLLARSKERQEANAFVAEGVRLVEEALKADWPFQFVLRGKKLSERGQVLIRNLEKKGYDIEMVTESILDSISETESSQGILAVLNIRENPLPQPLTFVLIPDHIRDPGNLGTLLRAALAAGVEAVLVPPETADPFSPKVVRSGMGAHFRIPIQRSIWDEINTTTSGLNLYLADVKGGSPYWDKDFRNPIALIIGGEEKGASQEARNRAVSMVSIPMPGMCESLNAAMAGAILMFEVVRQRTGSYQ
jgi:TrmH family RNA methyltransferase